MAKYQSAEVIHDSILLLRVVVGKIFFQSLEEFLLSTLLALEAEAYERGDCSAHAGIDRLGVSLHFIGDRWRKADAKPLLDLAPAARRQFAPAGTSWRDCF